MEEAKKAIDSTLRKNEKALATLRSKNARQWQQDRVAAAIRHHRAMLDLLDGKAVAPEMREETMAAIPGYIAKIQAILPKFAPGTPQHTLAVRRIAAYEAVISIAEEI